MNRERIARLINFDENDTSTGYVSVGDKGVWRYDPKKGREVIRSAKDTYMQDGRNLIVYVDGIGEYTFSRLDVDWYEQNSGDCIKVLAVLGPGYGNQPSIYRTYTKEGRPDMGLYVKLKTYGFPDSSLSELINWPDGDGQ